MIFDMKTLMVLYVLVNFISFGSIMIIWQQNRKRFGGISFWLADMILQTVGILLILLREHVPDFMSIIAANSLILIGDAVLLVGLGIFVGKKTSRIFKIVPLLAAVGILTYFTVVSPNLTVREITISSVLILITAQASWLMLRSVSPELVKITRITGIVLSGYIVVSIARIILLLMYPLKSSDYFKSGTDETLPVIFYIGLTFCLTVSLVLMVNERLFQQVKAQDEKFTLAFHSSPYAILLTRLSDGVIYEVNDGFVNIFGFSYADAVGKTTLDLHIWEKDEKRAEIVGKLQNSKQVQGLEYPFRKKSGEMLDGLFSANVILVGKEKFILSSIIDITEMSQMKKQLQERASHDDLTGLPNRKTLYDHFDTVLANAKRNNRKFAVMSLDIDEFKLINDRMGHSAGDLALQSTAKKLKESLRELDMAARFGGDEFVILLWEVENGDEVQTVARRILEGFREPIIIGEEPLVISLCIGIAIYPDDGEDINVLVKKSDDSMYYVKENGKNNYQLHGRMVR